MHDWTDTQEDGWFRITLDQLKIPYTYIADTKVRETSNLRDQFDVIIVPPFADELARVIQGLPMQGPALPWKNTPETPSFVAPGLDESDDIRGGLGYSGVAGLEHFVREGGLLIAVGDSVALPVQGGMTRAVSLRPSQKLVCPGDVLLADVGRLHKEVSFSPKIGLAEGLAGTVDWWREHPEALVRAGRR